MPTSQIHSLHHGLQFTAHCTQPAQTTLCGPYIRTTGSHSTLGQLGIEGQDKQRLTKHTILKKLFTKHSCLAGLQLANEELTPI